MRANAARKFGMRRRRGRNKNLHSSPPHSDSQEEVGKEEKKILLLLYTVLQTRQWIPSLSYLPLFSFGHNIDYLMFYSFL